jgi:hypothetical protein
MNAAPFANGGRETGDSGQAGDLSASSGLYENGSKAASPACFFPRKALAERNRSLALLLSAQYWWGFPPE